ncbi:hypothetical protein GF339_23065, partial [candidate division KSB3 bacterium]|nr:hypothetical protein [candidate division KSB3 bacterium]
MHTMSDILNRYSSVRSYVCGIVLALGIVLSWLGPASAEDQAAITEIHIVTPAWEEFTNEDGTGVWFEIVRAVYEPVGITMTYEFAPWKRAMEQVASAEADAFLGEYESETFLMPRYPLDVERTAVVFKKGTVPTWEGSPSLVGKNVVWLRGYDYHLVSELEGLAFDWYEIDNYAQAWGMLEKDRA